MNSLTHSFIFTLLIIVLGLFQIPNIGVQMSSIWSLPWNCLHKVRNVSKQV